MTVLETKFLLTESQLAEILQVKSGTIRTWVKRGKIPKSIIFRLADSPKGTIRFISSKVLSWLSGEVV